MSFKSEVALQSALAGYFKRLNLPHREQVKVGDGRADFEVHTPSGSPWGLLEIKNGLCVDSLCLADAADYFEQAAKYRIASGLPVFLGPFFIESHGVTSHFTGGPRPKTVAALSAFGGRLDVGLFFVQSVTGFEDTPSGWHGLQMTLRQKRVAAYSTVCEWLKPCWPAHPVQTIDIESAGSLRARSSA